MSAYAENLLCHLVRAGHDVTLVSQYRGDPQGRAVYGGGPPPADRVPAGVEVVALEARGEQAVNRGEPADFERDVAEICQTVLALHARAPFDVVHAQYAYPTGFAALAAARTAGLPAVVSVQGGDGHWVGTCCPTHRDLLRAVFAAAPALLIGSDSFASEVCDRHGVDPGRFTVVPGATDTERFVPGAEPGSVHEPARLLYHGRVDARKGVLDLLAAMRLLLDTGRRVRLAVSGIGPDSARLAEQVRADGLAGHVDLLGYVRYEDAHRVYRYGDVFVSPTYAEGFSNTILEAMASGLPVVSTDVVGVRDCVRDGENGVLVPAADPAALAGAVGALLDDAPRRRRLAGAALAEVRQRWSWPVIADQITNVYHRVLRHPVPVPALPTPPVDLRCRFRSAPHLL
jgi:glycosyltransferase involved in cell wall biosynthesis